VSLFDVFGLSLLLVGVARFVASRHGFLTVVIGINKRDSLFSGTTLFNAVVVIGPDGTILNRHRKLMPTNPERMVWGMGDAAGLRVVDTPAGRVGSLICWESYMPLARYALYARNRDLCRAYLGHGENWLATLRHIAREAGCWVIGTATALQGCDLPSDFPERDKLFKEEECINDGDAVVIEPIGAIAAGLYAEIDIEATKPSRRSLDVCGHYSRPDIFSFSVNRKRFYPVVFSD
jgi:nitrilase